VIDIMLEQKNVKEKGGTMRLGSYPCILGKKTKTLAAYREQFITERHRHRYEVNNAYRSTLALNGLVFSGLSPDGNLVEMIEIPGHRWFIGCQFHPELKSRLLVPHPLFRSFVKAAIEQREDSGKASAAKKHEAKKGRAAKKSGAKKSIAPRQIDIVPPAAEPAIEVKDDLPAINGSSTVQSAEGVPSVGGRRKRKATEALAEI
jgi:hypothetical protein